MSEYMEKHAVSKLIGSPPGYVGHEEGGQLTERIRRNPYSVILFDEIEKAHPDIANLLLQILEDGILTDAYGNLVDFKNTLIIMTSNIGTKHLVSRTRLGFGGSREIQSTKEIEELVLKELKRDFSPEFINRIDETIVFHPLGQEELAKICRLLIDDVNTTLAPKGALLDVDDAAVEWLLAQSGEDPNMGARPLPARDPEAHRGPRVGAPDPEPRGERRGDRDPGRARRSDRDRSRERADRSANSDWLALRGPPRHRRSVQRPADSR